MRECVRRGSHLDRIDRDADALTRARSAPDRRPIRSPRRRSVRASTTPPFDGPDEASPPSASRCRWW